MLIIGHRFIASTNFYHTPDIEAINNTPPSSIIYIEFNEENLDIIKHADINHIPFSLNVKNISEIIYASSLNASYIIIKKELAKVAQEIANNYLFDAKILVHIEDETEIEELAIFSTAIIKTNS